MQVSVWAHVFVSLGQTPRNGMAGSGGIAVRHSVQFSRSVMSDSLQPHELQHARPPCPSPTPRVQSNSSPSNW